MDLAKGAGDAACDDEIGAQQAAGLHLTFSSALLQGLPVLCEQHRQVLAGQYMQGIATRR